MIILVSSFGFLKWNFKFLKKDQILKCFKLLNFYNKKNLKKKNKQKNLQ